MAPRRKKPSNNSPRQLSSLLNMKGGMVKGNVQKGGLRFGPQTTNQGGNPFEGNYGAGGTPGTSPGYLGPPQPAAPLKATKRGKKHGY
jgi:hypothetical protein